MKNLKLWTFMTAALMSSTAQASSVYVREIKVDGLERVEPETVMSYVDVKKGKESITHFENVHCNENYSLLHCSLETGRTHQIRVSLFYYDMPILNDPIYNTRKNIQNADKRGQVLHAYKLIFNHPITGEKMILHAPFDEYFKQCLNKCFPQEEIQLDF